jgi:hypothetical protein
MKAHPEGHDGRVEEEEAEHNHGWCKEEPRAGLLLQLTS